MVAMHRHHRHRHRHRRSSGRRRRSGCRRSCRRWCRCRHCSQSRRHSAFRFDIQTRIVGGVLGQQILQHVGSSSRVVVGG